MDLRGDCFWYGRKETRKKDSAAGTVGLVSNEGVVERLTMDKLGF